MQDYPLWGGSSALLCPPKINPFDRVSDLRTYEYSCLFSLLLRAHIGRVFCCKLTDAGDQWISSNKIWLNQTNLDPLNQSHSLFSGNGLSTSLKSKLVGMQRPTVPGTVAMGQPSAGTTVFHSDAFSKSHSLPNMHGTVRYNNTAAPLTQMHQGKWLCKWPECQRILQTAVHQRGKCVIFVACVMNLRYMLTLY